MMILAAPVSIASFLISSPPSDLQQVLAIPHNFVDNASAKEERSSKGCGTVPAKLALTPFSLSSQQRLPLPPQHHHPSPLRQPMADRTLGLSGPSVLCTYWTHLISGVCAPACHYIKFNRLLRHVLVFSSTHQ